MNPDLEKKLYEKYPKIFKQVGLSAQESCMAWGVACNDGWYHILDDLCATLQKISDQEDVPQVEAAQIKEKFGTLCFYVDHATEEHRTAIRAAEALSARTCERCGTMRDVKRRSGGWILTLCDECEDKKYE
jgi:hypothetical protein